MTSAERLPSFQYIDKVLYDMIINDLTSVG